VRGLMRNILVSHQYVSALLICRAFAVHVRPPSTRKLLFCSATTLHVIDTKRATAPRRLNET
jgi:hypothetical protein